MPEQTRSRLSWLFVGALCLQHLAFAQSVPQTSNSQSSNTDEAQLRAVVDKYFAAYAREDLDALTNLWSAKSVDPSQRREELQKLFKANDSIEVKALAIRKLTLEGAQATVRLALETSATDAKTGKPAKGFGKTNRILQLVKEQGEWRVIRDVSAEGDLATALVDKKTAEEREALLAEEKELVTAELWKALIRQATPHIARSNYAQALNICRIALAIAERLGDKEGIAQALNDTGVIYLSQGSYGVAIENLQRSLLLREELGDKMNAARAQTNLATIYSSQGNYRLGAEYYQKALAEFESLKLKPFIGVVLNNIGTVYHQQGNYSLAFESYEKALKYFEELGDNGRVATAFNNMGAIQLRLGNYGPALDYLQKSLKLKEATGNKGSIALSLQNVGEVYRVQGKYDLALEYFQKSQLQFEAVGEKARGYCLTLSTLGQIYLALGEYPKALEFSERARVIAEEIDLRDVLWEARTTAGRAHLALNQPAQARQAFTESIATVETLRAWVVGGEQEQARFFEDKTSPYNEMVGLLVTQSKDSEALAYAEQAKARVLLDVLSRGRVDVTKAMTTQERDQENKLKGELISMNQKRARELQRPQPDPASLASLKEQLQKARLEYEVFKASLYTTHSELKTRRGEAITITPDEAAALLPGPRSALLEYVVTEDKTYLFVLTNGSGTKQGTFSLKTHTLAVKRKELQDQVESFRRQLAKRDLAFRASATQLYDLLLKPATSELDNKDTLVIVPDGTLWELPFQALQDSKRRYLVESHAISYAPSLTVLREMRNLRRKKASATDSVTLLAFGNPAPAKPAVENVKVVQRDERLAPLPEAEKEVKTLAQLYGASRSKVYVGAAAREDRLKAEAGTHRILQLAAHAVLDNASPMYSYVLLAQDATGPTEDGVLEAWEMMNLDLRADLVVLSACETGRGRIGAGEGVIGMAWALFVAGSPTTVVSLWNVDSSSTTELMLEFHRNLLSSSRGKQSSTSKAKALQEAAIKLLRSQEYRHPFYWAGFSVVGDGS